MLFAGLFMVELFTQAKFVGFIRNHLKELSSNKMKMNLIVIFTDFQSG